MPAPLRRINGEANYADDRAAGPDHLGSAHT